MEFANGAKNLLEGNLWNTSVNYKGDGFSNPVTAVDVGIEEYLRVEILNRFPNHMVIGEEHEKASGEYSDFIWIIDPIDGTSNFIAGLPIYSISIGLFYRGNPIIGVMFSPLEKMDVGIYRSRIGGGSFVGSNKLAVMDEKQPGASKLIGLPGGYKNTHMFRGKAYNIGNARVTGSITFEMLMVAKGVFQYSFFSNPKIWDVAAGIVMVKEAGGEILVFKNYSWNPLENFMDDFSGNPGEGYLVGLRNWSRPLLAGNADLLKYITDKNSDTKMGLKSGINQLKKLFNMT